MNFSFGVLSKPWVIGMVHLAPLPGTPFHEPAQFESIRANARADARALLEGGASGCLVQTVDRVYHTSDTCDPARLAAMTLITSEIVEACGATFPVGVQIMKNALSASLAVAKITGAHFIRASAWVGATASAFGVVRADPATVSHYRRSIGANDVAVVADIHSQHFRWLDGEMPLARLAHWAVEAGADALCLGQPSVEETRRLIEAARRSCPDTPVILPGNTTPENAADFFRYASGAFVGGCLKDRNTGRIDKGLVRSYVEAARGARHV